MTSAYKSGLYPAVKPCRRGHWPTMRIASSRACAQCRSEMMARKWAENLEQSRARNRDAKARNRATIREQSKARYAADPERAKEHSRRYRERYPDLVAAAFERWREKNMETVRAHSAKRRARKRSAEGAYTATDVRDLLRLQDGRCAYCRRNVRRSYHVDHIKPLVAGGGNDRKNLQIVCPSCNSKKGARDPIDYAQTRGLLL
jgi:5-methylcytosine-specific restriction endonuclease McrA